jgi:mono/diheme cytochrome c family protein
MRRRLFAATAIVGACATAGATFAQTHPDPALERGAWVAQRDCAQCHAVGLEGRSPNSNAPTFREIRLRFNPISLERRLHPMPVQGHDAMPPRSLSVADVPDLVAYIQSLESTR